MPTFYVTNKHKHHRSGKLIAEQQTYEYNPLFAIAQERNGK